MTLDKRKTQIAMARNVLSTRELCKKAGIHNSTLARILSEHQTPTPQTIGKIASALGVPVESIIKEEDR